MDKRFLMVGVGLVAALSVLTLTILVGGPGRSTAKGPAPQPPTLNNPGITAEDLHNARPPSLTDVGVVRDFQLFSEDGKTITLFTGDEVSPQPDFVSDVIRPAAEVRFDDHRMLRITADAGRFYHPGNEPNRGEFHANTIVTQYQSPDDQKVDPNNDDHVQFRMYLDDATQFDRENGHIYSDGPVRLVGPAVDFTGTGLDLTFNMLDQRIERLVIATGDQLRLAQRSSLTSTQKTPSTDNPTQGSGTSVPVRPPTDDAPTDTQPYRVLLHDNLHITVGPGDTTLTGDQLEVLFTLANNPPQDANDRVSMNPRAAEPTRSGGDKAPDQSLYYINEPIPAAPIAPDDLRALLTPSPDDILVTWTGRLELTPLSPEGSGTPGGSVLVNDNQPPPGIQPPAPKLPPPDHATLTLRGQPATLHNPADQQQITAAAVGYRTESQTVFATGNDAHPLLIQSPDLGTLQGSALTLNQEDATGTIQGPGRLTTEDQQLDVTFANRLDLAFLSDADGSPDRLERATFQGNVHALAASAPAPGSPDDPNQQLDLTSDRLTLTLTTDADGNPQPAHLQAAGLPDQPVLAKQPHATFQAQQLDIDLASASDSDSDSKQSKIKNQKSKITIARLRALTNVRVTQTDPDDPTQVTTLTAHALDADPNAGRLELFGRDINSLATLTRPDAALAGVHLILIEGAQTADALGPGTFTAQTDPDDPAAKLNVSWSDSMTFNNTAGHAEFVGEVRAASTSTTDDTSLDAHSLTLTFVPEETKPRPAERSDNAPERAPKDVLNLRRAHALADPDNPDVQVNFTAQTFAPPPEQGSGTSVPVSDEQKPLTRITLLGRELLFINQPPNLTNATPIDDTFTVEQVIVPTRGRMLLEDYRSEGSGTSVPVSDNPKNPRRSPISFAGRGLTLFAWEQQLTLDAQANDLKIEGDVFMLHQPDPRGVGTSVPVSDNTKTNDGSKPPLKLDAQRLVADLTETGGLGAYLNQSQSAPRAQIRRVTADGRVRVAQGPSNVVADHLEYDEKTRTVLLWAEPRREVVLNRDDQPNGSTTARALRWDLDNDLFTALEPGTGVIPIE